jgi:hypothetical protein
VFDPEKVPPSVRDIVDQRIDRLGLVLEGSSLERHTRQLHHELERKGIRRFRPAFYLTDEWGCPDGQPIIGIPFYLANEKLRRLERHVNGLETAREIMMYMRHEAGHALNYAYRLYKTEEWRKLFGPFHRKYDDDYRPVAFSRKHVRHIPGWYAQKHPDEDFAETFAVWLTPRLNWKRKYKTWPAITKLQYVDRVVRSLREVDPPVPTGEPDLTVGDMKTTVSRFYKKMDRANGAGVKVALESDLGDMFIPRGRRRKNVKPAWRLVHRIREPLADKITYWTGLQRPIVLALVRQMVETCRALGLDADVSRESDYLVELTAYGTALAMNKLVRGKFEHL